MHVRLASLSCPGPVSEGAQNLARQIWRDTLQPAIEKSPTLISEIGLMLLHPVTFLGGLMVGEIVRLLGQR